MKEFKELKGMIITSITGSTGDDEMVFTTDDNRRFRLDHDTTCCESVTINDICGDLSDLLNTPILSAEEVCSDNNPEGVEIEDQDSFTWTFYKLHTINGGVTIRWYGESNGYYSESVDFYEI